MKYGTVITVKSLWRMAMWRQDTEVVERIFFGFSAYGSLKTKKKSIKVLISESVHALTKMSAYENEKIQSLYGS